MVKLTTALHRDSRKEHTWPEILQFPAALLFARCADMHQYSVEPHLQSVEIASVDMQQPVDSVQMAMLPTPITPFELTDVPDDVKLHVKRDDLTGMQMSGNKARFEALPL